MARRVLHTMALMCLLLFSSGGLRYVHMVTAHADASAVGAGCGQCISSPGSDTDHSKPSPQDEQPSPGDEHQCPVCMQLAASTTAMPPAAASVAVHEPVVGMVATVALVHDVVASRSCRSRAPPSHI